MRTIALLLASVEATKLATETKQYDMYGNYDMYGSYDMYGNLSPRDSLIW